ncbi:hypothetical protein Tco_0956772, partial [Tanacetum coccineum]
MILALLCFQSLDALFTVGSICDHTDCQCGNPCVKGCCASFGLILMQIPIKDPHASTLAFDPHASTLALEYASDVYALANIHALAFSMSFQEGFTSLSLHP